MRFPIMDSATARTGTPILILPDHRSDRVRSGKAADRGCLRIVDMEYGEQLRNLQDFVEFLAQVTEAHRCAVILGAHMGGDLRAESRAVNPGNVVHFEDDLLFPGGDHAFEFLAHSGAFLAQHDTPVQRHYGYAVYIVTRHFHAPSLTSFFR